MAIIALKTNPQVPRIDTVDGLKSKLFVPAQDKYNQLLKIISDAEAKIDAERKKAASAPPMPVANAQDAKIVRTVAARQTLAAISAIRKSVDAQCVVLVKDLRRLSAQAEEMATRHWDIRTMLRLFKISPLAEAIALRANYSELFEQAGPAELTGWAQNAIDSFDLILMDCVIRANDSRPRNERAFESAALIAFLQQNWNEYKMAQATLNGVVDFTQRAGLAYSEFERGRTNALGRISLGLQAYDYELDESGALVEPGSQRTM